MAAADLAEVEELIRSTGFFRAKARNLVGMAQGVVERFDGEVPSAMEDLVTLPGVGRKTANVVRSVAFGLPGLPGRHPRAAAVPSAGPHRGDRPGQGRDGPQPHGAGRPTRGAFSLRLILHGRAICTARSPHCDRCVLADFCPSARPAVPGPTGRPWPAEASGGEAKRVRRRPRPSAVDGK